MLSHIDYLDEAIERLSAEVETKISPYSGALELVHTVPGIDRRSAEVFIAETGADMSRFPGAPHLASWAGMCPWNEESAGKHGSGKTRKGSKWLRAILIESAEAGSAATRRIRISAPDYLLLHERTETYTNRLVRQLERLGHNVTLESQALSA